MIERQTLTEQDIEILLEAMGLYENKHSQASFSIGLMGAMLKSRDVSQQDRANELQRTIEDARHADQLNSEVAILIKAKLIQMKREAQSRSDATAYPTEGRDR